MRVAITGASGFIGRTLSKRFRELGWTVHGFGLRPASGLSGPVRVWDVAAGPLAGAPEVDAVVHTAALVHETAPVPMARRVNVGGTQNVSATFGDARLVHVSTCSVYDPWHPQVMATEDEAPDPSSVRWTNAYGLTKSEAERWLLRARPDAVILRPHAVYGAGDTTLMPRIRAAVRRGVMPLPGPGTQKHSITWVENFVEACRLACGPTAPGGVYNIADPEPIVLADAVRLLATPPGGPAPRVQPLPVRALYPVAVAAELAGRARTRFTGTPFSPRVTRYSVEHLGRERTFDISRAQKELGYDPRPSQLEGSEDW
ncbi:NAD-dependent epimerase/dehydratase family protein [Spongisporangium articulatum]|uniref:NAD-dependent epimerase/dehydratase family protein n=1 Tax=Spongisporangium articulatum TaxID=3362603 RepID=A0ABW8APT1_9ACTN